MITILTEDKFRYFFRVTSSPESPNTDLAPSLACEEVFEDESSCISLSEIDKTVIR